MDKMLERLNRLYPNSGYVSIAAYNPETFADRKYDSSFDTKVAQNRWNTNPLTYEQAVEQVEKGGRVGWIVPTGFVIVDIDNKDDPRSQSYLEKLLEKFEVKYSYNYTSKGMHLLFRDPTEKIKSVAKQKCGINIEIDTRANKSGYIVLPCNDIHRAWGEWNDYVEDIPYFLTPILSDSTPSFIGMVDGDGRNDALFKWRSQLERSHKLTDEQIEKCIRIINENLFDAPMANKELYKTVLREKKLDKQATSALDKDNVFNKLADDIIAKHDLISYYSNFYKFNGIYYKPITDLELEQMIHFELSSNLSKAARKEIIEFVKIKTQTSIENFNKTWYKIATKTGVLNLVTGEVEQANKTEINTIYIPYEYNPDPPYSPRIDQFMKDITNGDPIKMMFLYQIAGYCLLKKNLFEKFVICKGEGGTGKSTFMNLLHKLVGGDVNCSHIGLADFDKDYYLASTVGKLVNIDDDVVDGKTLENTGRFKSIISGNIISVRQIYKEVMDFVPYITCIFSCNRLPRIMDKTSGLYRRMILIELNNKVKNPDPQFMDKITETDMQYFLFKAVEGIKLALEEGRFRITQSEMHLLELFKRRQSPLHEWLYSMEITTGDLHNKAVLPLYKQYTAWCEDNGYSKTLTAFSFKEDICALYDVEIEMTKTDEQRMPKQSFVKRGEFDPNYRPF